MIGFKDPKHQLDRGRHVHIMEIIVKKNIRRKG